MRAITIVLTSLLTFNLNAQTMNDPNEVVTRLFVSTDQRLWNEVNAAFHSKVLLDYSSMNGQPATELGPQQIIDAWKGILPGFELTHHQLGNFITHIDGQNASVFCYGTAHHYLADEDGHLWTVVGSYDFDLVQDKQKNWKISSMKFNFKFQNGNTSLPEKAMNALK